MALLWNGYLYLLTVPEGLENVSRKARRIAHLQRPRWQFQFAKYLLAERLGPIDRELRDLQANRSFVVSYKPKTLQDYIEWSQSRIQNLLKMLHVAKEVIIQHFPAAINSSEDKPVEPRAVLDAVDTLTRFYTETIEFDRSLRAVMPNESVNATHEMMFTWSSPIRNAVHEVFRYLQQIIDTPKSSTVHFNLVFESPPRIDEFNDAITKLDPVRLGSEW